MLIIGDVQVHTRRADPTTAFSRMRDTLMKADLVYIMKSLSVLDAKGITHVGAGRNIEAAHVPAIVERKA
jgi:hypothetical protein